MSFLLTMKKKSILKNIAENKNIEAVFALTVRKATVFMDKQQNGLRISAWLW